MLSPWKVREREGGEVGREGEGGGRGERIYRDLEKKAKEAKDEHCKEKRTEENNIEEEGSRGE